jgi:penicillin-binding protein 1A
MGISPELVTVVWVGGQSRDIILRGGQGATMALPIWAYYMKSVFSDKDLKVARAGYRWKEPMPAVDCEADTTSDTKSGIDGLLDYTE